MPEVLLFGEDFGHEVVVRALIERVAKDRGGVARVKVRSSRGGYGRMQAELESFVRDLVRQPVGRPDLLVLATDANCVGRRKREEQLAPILRPLEGLLPTVMAIPDPHIERWLLIDSQAFKAVLGRGCNAPTTKCQRDLYKDLLAKAVSDTDVRPLIGGMEHAEEIVKAMDLRRMRQTEESLGRLIDDLERAFSAW
jgi:hypothetical protein